MKPMNENLVRCESQLERHPHGVRDQYTGIIYDKLHVMSEERWCHDCLDTYKCKFANHILDILAKKAPLLFKNT